jgi:hypothetical protein
MKRQPILCENGKSMGEWQMTYQGGGKSKLSMKGNLDEERKIICPYRTLEKLPI